MRKRQYQDEILQKKKGSFSILLLENDPHAGEKIAVPVDKRFIVVRAASTFMLRGDIVLRACCFLRTEDYIVDGKTANINTTIEFMRYSHLSH